MPIQMICKRNAQSTILFITLCLPIRKLVLPVTCLIDIDPSSYLRQPNQPVPAHAFAPLVALAGVAVLVTE